MLFRRQLQLISPFVILLASLSPAVIGTTTTTTTKTTTAATTRSSTATLLTPPSSSASLSLVGNPSQPSLTSSTPGPDTAPTPSSGWAVDIKPWLIVAALGAAVLAALTALGYSCLRHYWRRQDIVAAAISKGTLLEVLAAPPAEPGAEITRVSQINTLVSAPQLPVAPATPRTQSFLPSSAWSTTKPEERRTPTETSTVVEKTLVEFGAELSIPGFLHVEAHSDFVVGQKISRGGTSLIYACQALGHDLARRSQGRPLAIKIMAESPRDVSEDTVRGFYQELSVMFRFVNNAHVAKIYGYSDTGPMAIILELYELGDLHKFIGRRGLAADRCRYTKLVVVGLAKQIGQALCSLHEAQIAHCDIKPANALLELDARGELVALLTDFGVARILDPSALKVGGFRLSHLKGASRVYAAPEVLFRFRNNVSEHNPMVWKAGDAYALSMVVHEMLMRVVPWKQPRSSKY